MKSIWKFNLKTASYQSIEMPEDAQILCVQAQYNEPKIWCLLDINKPTRKREFRIIGSGHEIEKEFNEKYIGTYQLNNGNYIFHVFDMGYK